MTFGTYRQYDARWGRKNYNGSSSYSAAACGPTSCANILYAIDPTITPVTTGNYMKKHGYAIRNQGTAWNGIPSCLKAFGARDVRQVDKMADVFSLMAKGYVGVFLFRKGTKSGVTWTTSGHYIAVTGYKHANGKHYIRTFDSGGRKHDGWYCYETQMQGLIPRIWLCKVTPEKVAKPKNKYNGTIPKPPLKNGSKGDSVMHLQRFLNWYHPAWKLSVDGYFKAHTAKALKAFQYTEGLTADAIYGDKTYKKALTYKNPSKPITKAAPKATPKGYTGTFPSLNNNAKIVNGLAYRYCYPYGTAKNKYTYKDGKPKPEYANGIDKAYPTHKKWSNKKQKVGACCDILVGSVLCNVGIKVPKDLKDQLTTMPKMKSLKANGHYKASQFKAGDVVQRGRKDKSGHTWIVCELVGGKKYVANAHYKKLNGTYAVMDAKPSDINKSKWKYYQCYTPQGAIRTWYGIGDYGYDVLYIQRFLKWAGFFNGACNGDYNKLTAEAVNRFQKSLGWEPVGRVGVKTIEAMKKVKK